MHVGPAGLHFGQIEHVVDHPQQVRACRVDHLGVLDLLGGEVARAVLREQFGQDQRAVQRGAQLVRHVGEELGLVLRRQRELFRALLQLLLLRLQLGGEPLGLAQQRVGAGAGDDRVQVDADGRDQLREEGLVHLGERAERAEFEHAEGLVLVHDGQHQQADRRRLAETGGDPHVTGRGLVNHDRPPAARRLPDQ